MSLVGRDESAGSIQVYLTVPRLRCNKIILANTIVVRLGKLIRKENALQIFEDK